MKNVFVIVAFLFALSPLQLLAQDVEDVVREHAIPFEEVADFEGIFSEISDQRLVLMGEATHGTSEFYHWRAELSKYLIEEKGYNFIAVEGDWPAFSRINEYVKHKPGAPANIDEAMNAIDRWPLWMWRNHEFKGLVEWLRDYNQDLPQEERVGLYGVDLYAKQQAMQDVVAWLEEVDADLSVAADQNYRCLSRFSEVRDYLTRVHQTGDDCSGDVEAVLEQVRGLSDDPQIEGSWGYFNAEQNAKLVINAERHFRANLEPGAAAWNHRAGHFELTAKRLIRYYSDENNVNGKGIVWAHNTHIGDARATDMARQGAQNIGHLSRERWGDENVYAIGFGTYRGEVFAAREWEGQREQMAIPEAQTDTWEWILNQTDADQVYLLFSNPELQQALGNSIPHRAIGVTYNPSQEGQGNFVGTVLPERYNAFIYFRETGVLDPLD